MTQLKMQSNCLSYFIIRVWRVSVMCVWPSGTSTTFFSSLHSLSLSSFICSTSSLFLHNTLDALWFIETDTICAHIECKIQRQISPSRFAGSGDFRHFACIESHGSNEILIRIDNSKISITFWLIREGMTFDRCGSNRRRAALRNQ